MGGLEGPPIPPALGGAPAKPGRPAILRHAPSARRCRGVVDSSALSAGRGHRAVGVAGGADVGLASWLKPGRRPRSAREAVARAAERARPARAIVHARRLAHPE